jgi:hypothetical protein
VSDALRDRIREDAIEHAAQAAWDREPHEMPWERMPASVQESMRALVRDDVEAVLEHLDARCLLDLDAEPDTYPPGTPFDGVIGAAGRHAKACTVPVRTVYQGVGFMAYPGDTFSEIATRYAQAADEAPR